MTGAPIRGSRAKVTLGRRCTDSVCPMRPPGTRFSARPLWAAALACVLLMGATGCAEGVPAKPAASAAAPGYVSDYVAPEATALAPLRGTTVAIGSLGNASIAAKIDNHPDARPQVGLERSDIVFEELVEGGMTRYVAVWQSDIPELLGPVRSIRPMDPDILSPFGGIVAYSGGQERFVDLMRRAPVYNAIHGQADTADTFFRSEAKAAPHNVLVRAQEVLASHPGIAAPAQQFAFALDAAGSTAAKDGTPTAVVNYRFSPMTAGSWAWDAPRSAFLRSQGTTQDLDAAGMQLSAANLIVLRVPVTTTADIPKTEMIGSGEAWVSTGGATVHANWSKHSATAPIRLIDDNGVVVRLGPGNSWIELIPTTGSVDFAAPPAG